MKKRLLFSATLVLLSLSIIQCSLDECYSKKVYLKNYETFIEDVSENYKKFSEEDWKKKDEKLKKYIEECYEKHEANLTDEEKKEIWAKSLKYYWKKFGLNIQKFLEDDSNEISAKFKEQMEKLKEYDSEDFEKIFKEVFQEDLSNLIDQALEGLEDFGKELKEALESEN